MEIHLTAVLCANIFSGMSSPTINRFLKETLLKEVKRQQISEPVLTQTWRRDLSKAQRVLTSQNIEGIWEGASVFCLGFFFPFSPFVFNVSILIQKKQDSAFCTAVLHFFFYIYMHLHRFVCSISVLGLPIVNLKIAKSSRFSGNAEARETATLQELQ